MTVRPKKEIPPLGIKWHRAILFLAALGTLAALIVPISNETTAGLLARPGLLVAALLAAALYASAAFLPLGASIVVTFAGVLLGCILASIGFLRIAAWNAFSNIYGPHWFLVASTVSLSLIGVVVWGTLTGSMLPFLLRRLGFDPATSSAPFVATLVDVTGLIIYFTVAILLLRETLL